MRDAAGAEAQREADAKSRSALGRRGERPLAAEVALAEELHAVGAEAAPARLGAERPLEYALLHLERHDAVVADQEPDSSRAALAPDAGLAAAAPRRARASGCEEKAIGSCAVSSPT